MVILHIKQKTRHTQRASLNQRARNVSFNIYTFSSHSLDDSLCSANCFLLSPTDRTYGGTLNRTLYRYEYPRMLLKELLSR